MEPKSLLQQPPPRSSARAGVGESGDFSATLRAALEQFASHVADDAEAVEAAGAVVRPLLAAYGEPVVVAQWHDAHGAASRRTLAAGSGEERGLREALTRRVERSRQWADFIRALNREFEQLLSQRRAVY